MSHNFLGTRGRVLSIKSSLCSHGVDSLVGRTGNEQKKKCQRRGKEMQNRVGVPYVSEEVLSEQALNAPRGYP